MGVNGNLWDLFQPYVRREGFDFIRDKKVAVDLSFWILQNETAIASSARNPHLRLTFFRTINLFVKFGAFPVFIVDGIPSPLKSQARIGRFYHFSGVDLSSLPSPDKRFSADRNRAFRQCVQECVELIKLLGLPVLQAKGEAEALCAQLNSGGYVDACITADSDAFLFGATCVIKCVHPNSKKPFECYNMSVVEAGLGLRRRHLIAISLLKENDHDLVGIQGIGLETALHFVRGLNEDQVLQRLEEAGSGQSPPPVDANNCSVALDNSPVQSQTKVSQRHCCVCGHPGSKQSHQKDVCGDCCTGPTHRGCVIKPAGFKCGCFICDMERKEKEKRKDVNWQMKVCKKISLGHNFPNPEIINLYLNNDNGHFNPTEGPQISWGAPNTEILVDYLAYHQNWDPSYIRQKMLPLLSTILLREMATNPTSLLLLYGQYGFDSVLRVKKSQGQELYVVKWRMLGSHHELTGGCRCDGKKIEEEKEEISVIDDMSHSLDESLDTRILVDNGCVFLLTDENKCLVQAAFPEQVQRFLKEKRERKQSSRRKGGGGGVQMSIKEFYRSTKMSFQRSKIQTLENNSPVAGEGSSRPVKRRLEF